jgi:hypothetical protein
MDLLSIGWKPLRKIKAGMVAAAVVQALHAAFTLFGAEVDESILDSIRDSVAQLWAIWLPIAAAYLARSRKGEMR